MEYSRINHFHSFAFPTILSSMMKSPVVQLRPTRNMNHSFAVHVSVCNSLSSCLWYQIDCHWTAVLVFKPPRFYLLMAPPLQRSHAGESDIRRRSHEVLHFRDKVKVLDLLRHFVISHHHEEWRVQYKILRDHIAITLLTVDCYNQFYYYCYSSLITLKL